MNLTPELFEQYFEVNGDTLIMSPLAAVCADSLGYNFTYNLQSDCQFQTVIVDREGTNIPELSYFGDRLSDGGTLHGRFPKKYVMNFLKNKRNKSQEQLTDLNLKSVTFDNDHCIVKCVKEEYDKTVVTYEDKSERVININKTPILASNISAHYDYLESCVNFDYNRINIRGSDNDLYKKIVNQETENCVFVGRLGPGCWRYEDVRPNVTYEMFNVGSTEKRDMFIEKLRSQSAHDLLYNLCHGEYIKLKSHHYKFIVNSNIFNL